MPRLTWSALLVLVTASCAIHWGAPAEEVAEDAPIDIVVDNALDEPVVVRIDARRIGEADAVGRTVLQTSRLGIARRHVRVCVHGTRSSRTRCHPDRLNVPGSAREILIDVRRDAVRASVL